MAEKLSIRAFARSLDVSHEAVRQAIKAGRLKKSVGYDKPGGPPHIADAELAKQEWARNTDQSKPRNAITGDPKHRREPGEPAKPMTAPRGQGAGGGGGNGPSYADARAVRENYMARLARLEFEEKVGKLIPADDVKVAAFNAARKARDSLLVIPDRIAPILAGMTDDREIHRVLTEEIRRVCNELGSAKITGR